MFEVSNQPPPLEPYNLFTSDTVLRAAVKREQAGWADDGLAALGATLGKPETIQLGFDANKYTPVLRTLDRYGHRLDEVDYHPAWHALMAIALLFVAYSAWDQAHRWQKTKVSLDFGWALGSLLSRHLAPPASPLQATALQMLAGGVLLGCASGAAGEWARFSPALVSGRSLAAVAYLVVFGSLVAFTAYVWLLRVASPALVSTYAFVNPIVAVFLGWLLAREEVGPRTLVAAAVIVGAVVLITLGESRRR